MFGGVTFRGTAAFFATELRVQLHEETAILTSVIVQGVLLTFVVILAPQYLAPALVGSIVFAFATLGQRVLNEAAYIRIDHRLNELYLAGPLTPEGYFLGMAGGVLVAYLFPVVILVIVATVLVPLSAVSLAVVAATCAAVWLFSVSVGYVMSTRFRDMRAIWSYASLFYNLLGVLPPVFYPIGLFPETLRPLALCLPPSAAVALIEGAVGGLPHNLFPIGGSDLALAAVALTVEALGMFAFAVYWARRTAQER